ncbi:acyltransferase family protein [Rhizobium sp. FY34]|uniref:acyltransferase family protein n=1 Tax=Rhizobium sp. FY34 TaxID=2562309 RepID=UPI0010BFA382|nr:acyltransferase family protein [Rhizobium sp. FY34]
MNNQNHGAMHSVYRPDIDGLRAIAVVSVVLYHYKFGRHFDGGFVGVDVFFVISGFLISRIIFDGINKGNFSIVDFYDRRIRRIFPALFVMFFLTLAFSVVTMFPAELEKAKGAVVFSAIFSSNIYLYFNVNYFDGSSILNPFLHTWSLSVEEQFYIFFPLFIYLIRNLNRNSQIGIILLVLTVSFILCVAETYSNASAAFYLVQYRAWELLIGSILALGVIPPVRSPSINEAIGIGGLTAIGVSVLLFTEEIPFPGLAAAAPCLGAAAIIYSGSNAQTVVSRLLGLTPLRFIGLISYSLYLWHWPLRALYYAGVGVPYGIGKIIMLLVALVIATASWWFVERPFRRNGVLRPATTLLGGGIAIGLVCGAAVISVEIYSTIRNIPPAAVAVLAQAELPAADDHFRDGDCFLSNNVRAASQINNESCLAYDPNRRNILIVGDSHAAHLWVGLSETYPELNFMQATASGCRPTISFEGRHTCTDLMRHIFLNLLPQRAVDTVIRSGRWRGSEAKMAIATAKALQPFAKRVIISGPIAEYDQSLPRLLAKGMEANSGPAQFASHHLVPTPQQIDALFASEAAAAGVEYFSVYDALCGTECEVWARDGVAMQFDYGHLTREGSIYLGQRLRSSPRGDLFSESQ